MYNETSFLNELKAGNQKAFSVLIKEHQKKVLNICFHFLLNRQDAEDTAQEVFVEAFKHISGFKGEAKIGTWLYRIATTRSLDQLRKRQAQKRYVAGMKILGLESIIEMIQGGKRPDVIYEEKEDWVRLNKALMRLPDNQRIAFTLSKLEDMPHKEIASILDVNPAAVDALIYRAKKKLEKEFSNPS